MRKNATELPSAGQHRAAVRAVQILKIQEVVEMTKLSKASIYRLSAQRLFPASRKIGIRSAGWIRSEIESFLADRPSGVRLVK